MTIAEFETMTICAIPGVALGVYAEWYANEQVMGSAERRDFIQALQAVKTAQSKQTLKEFIDSYIN